MIILVILWKELLILEIKNYCKTMNNNIPLWIKEILENDDIILKSSPIKSGNIIVYSSSVAGAKKLKSKISVAFFRDGPFLPISTGAANSIYWMMDSLIDAGIKVYLFYCYRGWSKMSLYKGERFTTVFISSDDFYSNSKIIKDIVEEYGIDICHFDSAEAVCFQKKLLPKDCKVVFEVHNVESDLSVQFKLSGHIVNYIKDKEKEAIQLSDVVLVRSDDNYSKIIQLGCDKNKLFKYRGGINVDDIKYVRRRELLKNNILFLGHLNYGPNQQAVEIITNKIAPKLNKKFIIAGKGALKLNKKLSSSNVEFIGWVEDLNKLFSTIDVAIAR